MSSKTWFKHAHLLQQIFVSQHDKDPIKIGARIMFTRAFAMAKNVNYVLISECVFDENELKCSKHINFLP